jgi:hypothetical protein
VNQQTHRAALIAYLREKVEIGDWHGVSDAANDLRVLEAQNTAVPRRCGNPYRTQDGTLYCVLPSLHPGYCMFAALDCARNF